MLTNLVFLVYNRHGTFKEGAVSVGKKCHSCKYDGTQIKEGKNLKYENIYVKKRRC